MAGTSLRDLRRDWQRWNSTERVVAALLAALLTLALPVALFAAVP